MTTWNYCPECKQKLATTKEGWLACPEGHFTKYTNPVAANSAFVRNNGEYLIIKRAKEPRKGCWDLPGGFIEYDETAEDALLREIKEETSLENLSIVGFLGAYPGSYGGIQKVLDLAYVVESADRNVKLSDENTEFKWVSLDKIPELAFEDENAALSSLRSEVL
jgi:ADP-ribose pyrophosphatase YjhB (NUDIX family)